MRQEHSVWPHQLLSQSYSVVVRQILCRTMQHRVEKGVQGLSKFRERVLLSEFCDKTLSEFALPRRIGQLLGILSDAPPAEKE